MNGVLVGHHLSVCCIEDSGGDKIIGWFGLEGTLNII